MVSCRRRIGSYGCKYLSALLAAALVMLSLRGFFFRFDTYAANQAIGQVGYYALYYETSVQNCNGVGTDSVYKLRLCFDDGEVWYSNPLDDLTDDNDQEEEDNNTVFVSTDGTDVGNDTSKWYAPAKPIDSIGLYQVDSSGGEWYWDAITVSYWAGGAWQQIAALGNGSFDATGGTIDIPYIGYLDDHNFVLTFNGNDGQINGEDTYQINSIYGATLPASNIPPDPLRTGFIFTNWDPVPLPLTGPENDATFIAQWQDDNLVHLTFEANGGLGGKFISQAYGTSLTAPVVTRTGYSFVGWSPEVPATVPAEDTTYTAQWMINSYTVTFDANGGSGGTSVTQEYGTALTAPEVTRSGYSFVDWNPEIPVTMPAENATYTARWYKDGLTVDLNLEIGRYDTYGQFIAVSTFCPGDTVIVRIKPETDFLVGATRYVVMFDKSVFSLVGENKAAFNPNTENDFYAAVAPDYTVATNIPASAWPLTFGSDENFNIYTAVAVGNRANSDSANGGYPGYLLGNEWLFEFKLQVVADQQTTGRSARIWMDERWVRDVENTSGSSYFAKCLPGQYSSQGDSMSYDFNIDTSRADRHLLVSEEPVSSTISFDLNGGTGTVPVSQTSMYGAVVALPAQGDIMRSYYTFLGWAETADTMQALASYNFPNADATLYAVWQRVPVTLTKRTGSTTVFVSEAGVNYIYGLEEGLGAQAFRNQFVQVNGDGRLQITLVEGVSGTGMRVDLYDNVTNILIKTYWTVIFGDVNGDGNITGLDAGTIVNVENYVTAWDPVADAAYIKATDINGDGNINGIDAGIVVNIENYLMTINQTTGLVEPI